MANILRHSREVGLYQITLHFQTQLLYKFLHTLQVQVVPRVLTKMLVLLTLRIPCHRVHGRALRLS